MYKIMPRRSSRTLASIVDPAAPGEVSRCAIRANTPSADHGNTASDAWAEQVQARRVLDEFRRRSHFDQSAGTLAGALERDRQSVADGRSRRHRIHSADRALE